VLLSRERFGRRHLNAFLLGEFFRVIYPSGLRVGAMTAFQRIGWLLARPQPPLVRAGEPLPDGLSEFTYTDSIQPDVSWWDKERALSVARQFEGFLNYLVSHPEEYQAQTGTLLRGTPSADGLDDWPELIQKVKLAFNSACDDWQHDYDGLIHEWKSRLSEQHKLSLSQLNAIAHQAAALWSTTVIEELGTRQFLPRYGFPIGLQPLTVPQGPAYSKNPIKLQRDGILAVSEYVPGSTLLVGGRTYTSHGLIRAWRVGSEETGFGKRCWKYTCDVGHVSYSYVRDDRPACPVHGCTHLKRDNRLASALASAARSKEKVALLFLDLDRFKIINDSLGHTCGDLLLQNVAERLKKLARAQDTVARLGGDEFLLILTGAKDVADAAVAAARVVKSMTAGFAIQGHSLSVSCSVGISMFPEHGADGETLIKNADAAMYSAKDSGRNNFRFFTDDMNAQVVERLTLENSLRLALDKNELFLMYQPQIDITTGKVVGLEALLRWQHPELGLVPPDRFIRIAENSGLILPIGEWVLRTACSQARKWQEEGLPDATIAVNVSAIQFRQEGFCELIRSVLDETGLSAQYLELELTESLLLSNADVTFAVLKDLKATGLKLAIDDFGTGYSSLSYLKHFPVTKLKIDRSFIRDVAVNPDDAAIATAIISMAKSLHLKVIAEGVENEAQMTFLRTHQCDEIQGYYFSKPLTVDQVAEKMRLTSVQNA
jgi:diguanylate cyclase (GGDEF)-like protein